MDRFDHIPAYWENSKEYFYYQCSIDKYKYKIYLKDIIKFNCYPAQEKIIIICNKMQTSIEGKSCEQICCYPFNSIPRLIKFIEKSCENIRNTDKFNDKIKGILG